MGQLSVRPFFPAFLWRSVLLILSVQQRFDFRRILREPLMFLKLTVVSVPLVFPRVPFFPLPSSWSVPSRLSVLLLSKALPVLSGRLILPESRRLSALKVLRQQRHSVRRLLFSPIRDLPHIYEGS